MGDFAAMNVGQLKMLLDEVDDDKPIRVWVEEKNADGVMYLEGRKLVGVNNEEKMCCLCALYYKEGE